MWEPWSCHICCTKVQYLVQHIWQSCHWWTPQSATYMSITDLCEISMDFFSNLTRVFARLLICLILIWSFFLFEFFALNHLVISADLFSYLCFEVRLICMYMCFLFGCIYTIRVSYCLIANFNGGCVFCDWVLCFFVMLN